MRVAAAVAALAAALALAVAGAAATRAAPRTLLVAGGPITAFAQNGQFVAWASVEPQNARCPVLVRIRDLVRRFQTAVTDAAGETCQSDLLVSRLALGLGADGGRPDARVLWLRYEAGNDQYWHLSTGSLGSPRERRVADVVYSSGDDVRVSLFGDGPLLGYAWSDSGLVEVGGCLGGTGPPCPFRVNAGGEVRVGVDSDAPATQAAPAAVAAAYGGPGAARIAVLVRGRLGDDTDPRAPLRQIELRAPSASAAPTATFAVRRPVRALALSASTVVVLTDRAIELYTISGKLRASYPVPAQAAAELAMSNAGVVYHVGRSIRLAGGGEIARAQSVPIGLSIDASRVLWAENVRIGGKLRGRVRLLVLP